MIFKNLLGNAFAFLVSPKFELLDRHMLHVGVSGLIRFWILHSNWVRFVYSYHASLWFVYMER